MMAGTYGRLAGLLVLAGLTLASSRTGAYDFEVTSRTEGYAYQLRRYGRSGMQLVNRRRFTQLLGVRVFRLLDSAEGAFADNGGRPPAVLNVNALMRFFVDFGAYSREALESLELRDNQFNLLLASVEGRNFWGWVDFSLGRQYDWELADIFAYDGVRLRLNTPWYFFLESYSGFRVNRNHPFSTAIFESDGTSGDVGAEDALGPTFGVAVGIDDDIFRLRTAYRGVASWGAGEDGEKRWGMEQELLFASVEVTFPAIGARIAGALRYNLLTTKYDEVELRWRQTLGGERSLEADFVRSRPHFDGDSIFNVFAVEPFDEAGLRFRFRPASWLAIEARGSYRRLFSANDPARDVADAFTGALSSMLSRGRWRGSLDLFFLDSEHAGRRYGGDVWGRWLSRPLLFGRRLSAQGRVSLVRYDALRLGGDKTPITTLGMQLGGAVRLLPNVNLLLSLENNVNRLYASAFRGLLLLDMEFQP